MNGEVLREARLRKGWTQQRAAERLGVTQAYLSMVEHGRRSLPASLSRRAVDVLQASPTALPLREYALNTPSSSEQLRSHLAALGYPGFVRVSGRARRNPAEVLLNALGSSDLDTRVVEGLPWLVFTYAELNWDWAVPYAKLHDLQNRLGFVTTVASQLAASRSSGQPGDEARGRRLKDYAAVLDRSRLAKEDTLCHDSLMEAEREWMRVNRSAEAVHWNLLTDMKAENLPHGRP